MRTECGTIGDTTLRSELALYGMCVRLMSVEAGGYCTCTAVAPGLLRRSLVVARIHGKRGNGLLLEHRIDLSHPA